MCFQFVEQQHERQGERESDQDIHMPARDTNRQYGFIFQCAIIALLAVCASVLFDCAHNLALSPRDIDEIEDHMARIANAIERASAPTARQTLEGLGTA